MTITGPGIKMKEIMNITDNQQIDLITDPFCLSILTTMEMDAVSKVWLAEELDERLSLVSENVDRLTAAGLIKRIEEDGEEKYQRVAENYELGSISEAFAREQYNYWLEGFFHHIQSNINDLNRLSTQGKNKNLLKEMNYKDTLRYNKVYLSAEDFEKLDEYIEKFMREHKQRPADEDNQFKPYEFVVMLSPDVSYFRKLVKEQEEK